MVVSENKKNPAKRKRTVNMFWAVLLSILSLFVVVRFCVQQRILNEYDAQLVALNAQIVSGEQTAKEVENLKSLYETDQYKERIARERLGLVSPGERVFIDVSGNK